MILRWLVRHTWKILKWLATGIGLYLLLGFLGSLIPLQGEEAEEAGTQVFVVSNGVHTDICIPLSNPYQDWTQVFNIRETFPGRQVRYLCFGWGDQNFFVHTPTWADLTPKTALKAVLWPSKTAIHLTAWSHAPEVHTRCRRLFLSQDQYRRLCRFLLDHLTLDDQGQPIQVGNGYSGSDAFFAAEGHYHLLRTCNEWTSEALRKAGIQTALWAPFAQSVMVHLP